MITIRPSVDVTAIAVTTTTATTAAAVYVHACTRVLEYYHIKPMNASTQVLESKPTLATD